MNMLSDRFLQQLTPLEETEKKMRKGVVADIRDSACNYYYNILTPADRKKYMHQSAFQYLLNGMPDKPKKILIEGFLKGLEGDQVRGWEHVYDWFGDNSVIIQELREDPGTDSMLRRMYLGEGYNGMYPKEGVQGLVDNYFLQSLSGGSALKNRFRSIVNWLKVNLPTENEEGRIVNLGSGTSGDTITTFCEKPELRRNWSVDCVDIDPEVIQIGNEFISKFGLTNHKFINRSFTKLHDRYYSNVDVGLIIGILCGLDFSTCVAVLKKIKQYFKPEGKLLAASLTEKMLESDFPCAYILRETAGWRLQYPLFGRLKLAYEKAGYNVIGFFQDEPTNFYEIAVGSPV